MQLGKPCTHTCASRAGTHAATRGNKRACNILVACASLPDGLEAVCSLGLNSENMGLIMSRSAHAAQLQWAKPAACNHQAQKTERKIRSPRVLHVTCSMQVLLHDHARCICHAGPVGQPAATLEAHAAEPTAWPRLSAAAHDGPETDGTNDAARSKKRKFQDTDKELFPHYVCSIDIRVCVCVRVMEPKDNACIHVPHLEDPEQLIETLLMKYSTGKCSATGVTYPQYIAWLCCFGRTYT